MKLPSPQHLIQCTVHVKMHPRPRSMTESREVLRTLERFGPVASYWHLRVTTPLPPEPRPTPTDLAPRAQYDANPARNSALATYATPAGAAAALAAQVVAVPARPGAADGDGDPSVTTAAAAAAAAPSARAEPPASASGMQVVVRPVGSDAARRDDHALYAHPYRVEPTNRPGAALLGGAFAAAEAAAETRGAPGAAGRGGPVEPSAMLNLEIGAQIVGPDWAPRRRHALKRERRERGWGTLGELWEMGEAERKKEKERGNKKSAEPAEGGGGGEKEKKIFRAVLM